MHYVGEKKEHGHALGKRTCGKEDLLKTSETLLREQIVISNNRGVPVARLIPVSTRPLGFDKGRVQIAKDFDAPLPRDIMDGFLGKPVKPKAR